ncbi:MAG: hypothetical protein EXR72_19985 [Myxococcales bacterium]|nr:hypothetical protein [Myxococcales bacterium]
MIDYDSHRWRDHFFDIRGSMAGEIIRRSFAFALLAVAVTVLHQLAVVDLAISDKGHTLVGLALGLLIVFRTNASYDRFWEGRKAWGTIVNETRNLARGASTLLAAEPALVARLLRWTIAFPYATMASLRGTSGLGPVAGELPAAEVVEREGALAARHTPLAVARRITEQLAVARERGLLSDWLFAHLDENVQILVDAMGACERIQKTPLPFAYAVHLRRALVAYCATLPLALLSSFGWLTIPATIVLCSILFGIEEIGVEIENPFGSDDNDLPLEAICESISASLNEVLASPRPRC